MARSETQHQSGEIGAVLTLAEIEARFPSEWLLLEDPEVDDDFEIVHGKLVCHSEDRDEKDRKAIEVRLRHSASFYTGAWPEDMDYAL